MLAIESTMRALTILLATFPFQIRAHSWIEQLTQIAPNGTFVGVPGYARGNVLRTAPGFGDPLMTNLIPPDGRASNAILPSDLMCMDSQRSHNQTEGSPRLNAPAGSGVALRYQENGHVTLPWNQPGKPANRGTVYVYGTQHPNPNDTLLEIHNVWNTDGTGGDGRGVLLSTQNFDDGRCYQINNGNISEYRQQQYPHVANQLMGANLWCQQDIGLPSDLPSGKLYTLYWVWDWPTSPHVDPNLPDGKNETYTTCIDIQITKEPEGNSNKAPAIAYISDQPLDAAAIPSQFSQIEIASQLSDSFTTSSTLSGSSTTSSTLPDSSTTSSTLLDSFTTSSTLSGSFTPSSTFSPTVSGSLYTTITCQVSPSTVTVTVTQTVVASSCSSLSPSSQPLSSPTSPISTSSVEVVPTLSGTVLPSTTSTSVLSVTASPSTVSTTSTTSTPLKTPTTLTTETTLGSPTAVVTPTLVLPTSVVTIPNPKIPPTLVTALHSGSTSTLTTSALRRRNVSPRRS